MNYLKKIFYSTAFIFFAAVMAYADIEGVSEYIVDVKVLRVRSAPDLKADVLFTVAKGEKVILIENTGKNTSVSGRTAPWFKIRSSKGKTGYLWSGFIKKIEKDNQVKDDCTWIEKNGDAFSKACLKEFRTGNSDISECTRVEGTIMAQYGDYYKHPDYHYDAISMLKEICPSSVEKYLDVDWVPEEENYDEDDYSEEEGR